MQSTELPCYRQLQNIDIFLFLQIELTAEYVEFLCEGSFLHSHFRWIKKFPFDKITLFGLQIDICLFKEVSYTKKKSKTDILKWKMFWFKILHSSLWKYHLLSEAQPDFADFYFKLEVSFWFLSSANEPVWPALPAVGATSGNLQAAPSQLTHRMPRAAEGVAVLGMAHD